MAQYFIWNDIGSVMEYEGVDPAPDHYIPISKTEYERVLAEEQKAADRGLDERRKQKVEELLTAGFTAEQIRVLTGLSL